MIFILVRKQTTTIWSPPQSTLIFPAVFKLFCYIYIYPYFKLIFTILFSKARLVKARNEWSFWVTEASIYLVQRSDSSVFTLVKSKKFLSNRTHGASLASVFFVPGSYHFFLDWQCQFMWKTKSLLNHFCGIVSCARHKPVAISKQVSLLFRQYCVDAHLWKRKTYFSMNNFTVPMYCKCYDLLYFYYFHM